MRLAGLLLLGVLPGAAVAYAALTGYLLNRVKPTPIVFIPNEGQRQAERAVEAVAA